jgi:hypothetical protein
MIEDGAFLSSDSDREREYEDDNSANGRPDTGSSLGRHFQGCFASVVVYCGVGMQSCNRVDLQVRQSECRGCRPRSAEGATCCGQHAAVVEGSLGSRVRRKRVWYCAVESGVRSKVLSIRILRLTASGTYMENAGCVACSCYAGEAEKKRQPRRPLGHVLERGRSSGPCQPAVAMASSAEAVHHFVP